MGARKRVSESGQTNENRKKERKKGKDSSSKREASINTQGGHTTGKEFEKREGENRETDVWNYVKETGEEIGLRKRGKERKNGGRDR